MSNVTRRRFLTNTATASQPFCLVITPNNPRLPWSENAEYKQRHVDLHPSHLDTPETRRALANYYTDVTKMDREVGETLDLLENNGLSRDTVFIYTSDHGPPFPRGKWELYELQNDPHEIHNLADNSKYEPAKITTSP